MSSLPKDGGRAGMSASSARVVRRILVSLGIGGLTYGLTTLPSISGGSNSAATLTSLTLSVFLGGVVLVVQFLMEFDSRLKSLEDRQVAHEERMSDLVDSAFVKLNNSARLLGLLEQTAARSDAVTQLVQHAIAIKPGDAHLVYDFAQREIGRTSGFLQALAGGVEAGYDGEDQDWLISLSECAQTHIDATSFATVDAGGSSFTDGFWSGRLGRRYLQAQSEAVRARGVHVRRIFIFDVPHLPDDDGFVDICAKQSLAGIDVRILDHNSIEQAHSMDLRDFIIFDGRISYETAVSASRTRLETAAVPSILKTTLVLDVGQIRKRAVDFEYLWSLGKPFERMP
jgi:hypothetical protein